jgi:hypothetical protein
MCLWSVVRIGGEIRWHRSEADQVLMPKMKFVWCYLSFRLRHTPHLPIGPKRIILYEYAVNPFTGSCLIHRTYGIKRLARK